MFCSLLDPFVLLEQRDLTRLCCSEMFLYPLYQNMDLPTLTLSSLRRRTTSNGPRHSTSREIAGQRFELALRDSQTLVREEAVPFIQSEASRDWSEYELLLNLYSNVADRNGKPYKKTVDRFREYINDRDGYFGSAKEYRDWKAIARAELNQARDGLTKENCLRGVVLHGKEKRAKISGGDEAQDIFFAWVLKGYDNYFKKEGMATANASSLIAMIYRNGVNDELKAKIHQVQEDYEGKFNPTGFNPRPMKIDGNIRLGTLSDHALGMAFDFRSDWNAHINTKRWNAILFLTGKSSTTAERVRMWASRPKDLYDQIVGINDAFVKKMRVLREDPACYRGDDGTWVTFPWPVTAVTAIDLLGHEWLAQWENGFFDLPWSLVKELHEEHLLWGATFSHPDLHHFELDKKNLMKRVPKKSPSP